MKFTLHSLRTLLGVKKRRLEEIEEQIKSHLQAVDQCAQHLEAARQHECGCADAEEALQARIHATLGAVGVAFKPSDLVTLRLVHDGLVQQSRLAADATRKAQEQQQAAQQLLDAARRAQMRLRQVLEKLEEHRTALLKERELAAEDQQDEETEEAAVARAIAARQPSASPVPADAEG